MLTKQLLTKLSGSIVYEPRHLGYQLQYGHNRVPVLLHGGDYGEYHQAV